MTPLFANRVEAGRRLAASIPRSPPPPSTVVLALPRGGVPVAAEIARALGAPMDVFLVRKLGVPGHEELAMGAVASGGLRLVHADTVAQLGISRSVVDQVTARELQELSRREDAYRGQRPMPELRDATVVLVDDGVATGSTMRVAVRALRTRNPQRIIVAAPVMARDARDLLAREADQCVTLATPEPFYSVGTWYEDFSQTSDAEVLDLLEQAGGGGPPARPLASRTPEV